MNRSIDAFTPPLVGASRTGALNGYSIVVLTMYDTRFHGLSSTIRPGPTTFSSLPKRVIIAWQPSGTMTMPWRHHTKATASNEMTQECTPNSGLVTTSAPDAPTMTAPTTLSTNSISTGSMEKIERPLGMTIGQMACTISAPSRTCSLRPSASPASSSGTVFCRMTVAVEPPCSRAAGKSAGSMPWPCASYPSPPPARVPRPPTCRCSSSCAAVRGSVPDATASATRRAPCLARARATVPPCVALPVGCGSYWWYTGQPNVVPDVVPVIPHHDPDKVKGAIRTVTCRYHCRESEAAVPRYRRTAAVQGTYEA